MPAGSFINNHGPSVSVSNTSLQLMPGSERGRRSSVPFGIWRSLAAELAVRGLDAGKEQQRKNEPFKNLAKISDAPPFGTLSLGIGRSVMRVPFTSEVAGRGEARRR